MLNFIENPHSNRNPTKPLVNYQPQLIYGHTEQSPNQFKTKFSIYYNNKSREHQPSPQKLIHPQLEPISFYSKKTIEKQKNIETANALQNVRIPSENSKRSDRHGRNQSDFQAYEKQKSIKDNKNEFKLTKGIFTHLLDTNKHNKHIGIVHRQYIDKQSRDDFLKKSSSTHQLSWNKSINTQSKYDYTTSTLSKFSNLISEKSDSYKKQSRHTKQNSVLSRTNSISIFEKKSSHVNVLRKKIEEFKEEKKRQTVNKLSSKYQNFGLPKIGVNHEIFLLDKKRYVKATKKEDEDQQINQELQKFQDRILKKFK